MYKESKKKPDNKKLAQFSKIISEGFELVILVKLKSTLISLPNVFAWSQNNK